MSESGVDIFAVDISIPTEHIIKAKMVSGGVDKIYKVKNSGAGTYMDMTDGLKKEDNPVQGWSSNSVDEGNQGVGYLLLNMPLELNFCRHPSGKSSSLIIRTKQSIFRTLRPILILVLLPKSRHVWFISLYILDIKPD